jgi:hypothetical protein
MASPEGEMAIDQEISACLPEVNNFQLELNNACVLGTAWPCPPIYGKLHTRAIAPSIAILKRAK